ncbi:MAG TPA: nucleoside-diphosphate kinase [Candidatus Paceibacterota bacterium]|nr:nucleoside-diphosphate kinase [Candidatus Paceibacterota bacterium]
MAHPKTERTLIILKPDAIQRALVGETIRRFENVGLKLVAAKMMVAHAEHVEKHYTLDPEWRRVTGEKTIAGYKEKGLTPPSEDPYEITARILEGLKKYMVAGPIMVMIWEGAHAVKIVRKLVGSTEPLSSAPGTIRGDYVLDSYQMSDGDGRAVRNLIHASGSPSEAAAEIAHWFKPEEIIEYRQIQDAIIYAPEMNGIFE